MSTNNDAAASSSTSEEARLVDPRVGHRGVGGHGYCIDCDAEPPIASPLCPPKRRKHPIIWAREDRRIGADVSLLRRAAPSEGGES